VGEELDAATTIFDTKKSRNIKKRIKNVHTQAVDNAQNNKPAHRNGEKMS